MHHVACALLAVFVGVGQGIFAYIQANMREIAQPVAPVLGGQVCFRILVDQHAGTRHQLPGCLGVFQRTQPHGISCHVVAPAVVHASACLSHAVLYKRLAVHFFIRVAHAHRLHGGVGYAFPGRFHFNHFLSSSLARHRTSAKIASNAPVNRHAGIQIQ